MEVYLSRRLRGGKKLKEGKRGERKTEAQSQTMPNNTNKPDKNMKLDGFTGAWGLG